MEEVVICSKLGYIKSRRVPKNLAAQSYLQPIVDGISEILRATPGPMAVADIEAEARAAGLLGRESPIGQNKTFRDARKELGVASSRDGFGPGSRYVLSLPDSPWMPKNSMDAPLEKRAPMTNQGIHEGSETTS